MILREAILESRSSKTSFKIGEKKCIQLKNLAKSIEQNPSSCSQRIIIRFYRKQRIIIFFSLQPGTDLYRDSK
jgi:hypothetical protein